MRISGAAPVDSLVLHTPISMRLLTLLIFSFAFTSLEAFAPQASFHSSSSARQKLVPTKATSTALASTTEDLQAAVSSNIALLTRAAETKDEDSQAVYTALVDLEKQMRTLAKEDPSVATEMLKSLSGDWRLIFTTGTAKTQQKFGKINYFPLKAVQSFRTQQEPMLIENGIYVGDFIVLKFAGTMEFDLRKRRLEFDFNKLSLFGLFDIALKQGEAASLGSKSGLGSEGNVKNAEKGKAAFFNWISADENIATARGGGGGLALWKRV